MSAPTITHVVDVALWEDERTGQVFYRPQCSQAECTPTLHPIMSPNLDLIIHEGALHELKFMPLDITQWSKEGAE
jgi:hypothetical protein